jgi:hypothetical protein
VGRGAFLKRAALVIVAGLVVAQALRPARTNPAEDPARTLEAIAHPPPSVQAVLDRSCRDCHTNRTVWPWYTNVAPISWFVVGHVNEGRHDLSFSNWAAFAPALRAKRLAQMCDLVQRGEMPLTTYLLLHRDARVSDDERQAICDWTDSQTGQ